MKEKITRMPSANPPDGLMPQNVPQLVSFTFDDNTYSGFPESKASGGIKFVTDTLTSRKNPSGDNTACFDGTSVAGTLYLKANNACENPFEDDSLIKKAVHEAYEKGFEIGSHTYSHPHGLDCDTDPDKRTVLMNADDWINEISRSVDVITKPWNAGVKEHENQYGPGIPRKDITGFRTPFIEFNDGTFTALQKLGFEYDASVEEGWQENQDGTNFLWPYTLDNGCEGDRWVSKENYDSEPLIGKHEDLWVLPNYVVIVPPDEKCAEYGTAPGARSRLKKADDSFDEESGKLTGIDWNIWFEFYMSAEDALASLKYTFDLRYNGNRCPWPIAFHSDIYSDKYDSTDLDESERAKVKADVKKRRETFVKFLDYILSKPDVRIVTAQKMLDWLKSPSALH